ncbi:hypothetical protein ACG96_07850 [Rhodococcoides fascians]|nr:hypothetical protein ACG96_07850 [Rhodococcus fascians]
MPPEKGTMPNTGKTTASTARCQMKIPYDQRPRVSITGCSNTRCLRPESASTNGESIANASTAPKTILSSNCHGSGRTNPCGPASGVADRTNAVTAMAGITHVRRAQRCTHICGPTDTSASTMPAANHGK